MRPEPQPSCWLRLLLLARASLLTLGHMFLPYGFAGSIFRRATMARVTRIATQSATRSDAITILLACDRPQTDKGIRRGGRRGARLGHSGTAVCGRERLPWETNSRSRAALSRESVGRLRHGYGYIFHRSAATRPPDCAGWTYLRKFKGFGACDGARGRGSRLCRVRGKERGERST